MSVDNICKGNVIKNRKENEKENVTKIPKNIIKYDIKNKKGTVTQKFYISLSCILWVIISVFKLTYINREYFGADYSVYALLFMPFLYYKVLDCMDDNAMRMSFNWICVVPMSMYLYRRQLDVLFTYSIMGMLATFLAVNKRKIRVGETLSAGSGFIFLNIMSIYFTLSQPLLDGANYKRYCAYNILKNAKMFGFSQNANEYLNMLGNMPLKLSNKYFIAQNIVSHGIVPVFLVVLIIVAALSAVIFVSYRRKRYFSVMAAAAINIQIICYFLSNVGVFENCVYEIIFNGNTVYTLCVLVLIFIMLDISHVFERILKFRS